MTNGRFMRRGLRGGILLAACLAGSTILLAGSAAMAAGDYLFEILKEPAFHKSFVGMMAGERNLPAWLAEITGKQNYVASPETDATIGATTYRLFHACEAQDCTGHELEVMFPLGGSRAYALLTQSPQRPRWFGRPDPQQQAALSKGSQD